MSGFTDSLILRVPVWWWPSLSALTRYPLTPVRSFCAGAAGGEAPHQRLASCEGEASGGGPSPADHSYGLSRLGTSAFLTAKWVERVGTADSLVEVMNPFTSEALTLEVAQYPPEADVSLLELATARRIRLQPLSCAGEGGGEDLRRKAAVEEEPQPRDAQSREAEEAFLLLTQRCREALTRESLTFLRGLARANTAGAASSRLHATLVSGDTGAGKRVFLEAVCRRLPPTLRAAGVTYVFEHRCLNFRDLLAQDEREAVQAIQATLRPIPHRGEGGAVPTVVAAVVLRLYHVDLLWQRSSGNALTDVAACQLCASIDALLAGRDANPTVFLLWSTATNPSTLAAPLRQRLAAQHLCLAPPAAEERMACLQRKLQGSGVTEQRSGDGASGPRRMSQAALLADRTSHMTAWQLSRWSVDELPPVGVSLAPLSDEPRSAYAHLFHVEAPIASLEELVVWPLTHLRLLRACGVPCAKGLLLCGPSGSGKTALLAALAHRLRRGRDSRGVHVMMVDGLSLVEKEVGRSERNIAQLFAAARAQAPTALFLDNLDALAPPRGRESSETTTATDRTLSTLLTEMDGVGGDPSRAVVVIASAPDTLCLDAAVRRPGRLDVHLTLTPPPPHVREAVVRQRLRAFLERLLTMHHFANADGSPDEEKLLELQGSVLDRYLPNAAAQASSAAQTVAVVRETMLAVLATLAAAPAGEESRDGWEWPQFKRELVRAFHHLHG